MNVTGQCSCPKLSIFNFLVQVLINHSIVAADKKTLHTFTQNQDFVHMSNKKAVTINYLVYTLK